MGQRILLLSLLAFAVAYTIAARQIPLDVFSAAEAVNSQTLPTIYGLLLSVVLLALLAKSIRHPLETMPTDASRLGRLAGLGVLGIAFVFMLAMINLWLALGGLLFAASWWLGERRYPLLLGVSSGVPLVGWLTIEVVLGVYLP